jgi:hypothetical protein
MNGKDIFLLTLIKSNLNLRYEGNTLFKNISRKYIKYDYLTTLSQLNEDVSEKNKSMVYKVYDKAYLYTLNYLDSFKTATDLIQVILSNSCPNVKFNNITKVMNRYLTLDLMLNALFSKGIQRVLYFYNFLDGENMNGDKFECWDELTPCDKNKLCMSFIIINQVFGDGNHRTSKLMHMYFDLDIDNSELDNLVTNIDVIFHNQHRNFNLCFPYQLELDENDVIQNDYYKTWNYFITNRDTFFKCK